MNKQVIYEIPSLYRDNFRVQGYTFGSGKNTACIVGAMRGNEVQQLYVCSCLIRRLKELEKRDALIPGHRILVVPAVNPYSFNIKKRFWPTDNTDINRMYPGYSLGETTQRIAAGVFEVFQEYEYGVQLASFYMPGKFMPHVRQMKAGYENVELAKQFGMPYVVLRSVRPYDTTTLNYNWQIWQTNAFSLYTTTTEQIDEGSAAQAVRSILTFLAKQGVVRYRDQEGYISSVVEDTKLRTVRTRASGFFRSLVQVGDSVLAGQKLAEVTDPYEGTVVETLCAPVAGVVFFMHSDPLAYANTAVFKLVKNEPWP